MILSAGCSSPGGFSLASANPFSQSGSASTKQTSPFRSVAQSTKNVLGKSRDAVTGVFGGGSADKKSVVTNEVESNVDPLRLDRKTDVGPEVFVANGRLWESTGNRQKAMESYTKALEVKPNDAKALASIARLHHATGNYPQAIDFFQKAIQQDPQESTLHNDLGLTLSKSGNNPAAIQALTQALTIAPGTSRYANNLASVQFDQGQSAEALQVLMANNKPAVAHYNMAYLLQEKGQLDEAKKHLTEAVKYKNEGQIDASIARAVNRSQEMLSKLDPGARPGLPPQTAIAKSTPPTPKLPSNPQVTIRQTSQSVANGVAANVKTAVAKEAQSATAAASDAAKKVNANFATARLGSQTVASEKTETPKAAEAPKTTGAFVLPPGFGQ